MTNSADPTDWSARQAAQAMSGEADAPKFPADLHNTNPGGGAGLPVGVELDGPVRSDRRLLATAHLLEQDRPTAEKPQQHL